MGLDLIALQSYQLMANLFCQVMERFPDEFLQLFETITERTQLYGFYVGLCLEDVVRRNEGKPKRDRVQMHVNHFYSPTSLGATLKRHSFCYVWWCPAFVWQLNFEALSHVGSSFIFSKPPHPIPSKPWEVSTMSTSLALDRCSGLWATKRLFEILKLICFK